jgi:hypothetical protein
MTAATVAAAAAAATAATATISSIEIFANIFSSNPYFIGLMMLILNLGGRFIVLEVTKGQEKFFQNPWFRRFLIFTVLFVATRNLVVAAIMTVVIVLFIGYLFNENSRFFLFGGGGGGAKDISDQKKDTLTVEEMEILNRLQGKAQKFAQTEQTTKDSDAKDTDYSARIYGTNLTLLQNK